MKTIHESPFCNTYGGLTIGEDEDGKHFLVMEDCFGPLFYGPLTEEQEKAYHVLCSVPPA